MTLEQIAIDELRREVNGLAAKVAAREKTLFSFQNAMIRFGSRVARCAEQIEKVMRRDV